MAGTVLPDPAAAALLEAEVAEKEAAAAGKERDDAANRARAAHVRAAAARQKAAAAVPDPDDALDAALDGSDVDTHVSDPNRAALDNALLLHEAAALLNLHTQAVAVNIRSVVHVILDVNSGSFAPWREQFVLAVGKYSLQDHIFSDVASPGNPDWARMDCVVRSWIAGTISHDLADAVLESNSTARSAWLAVETQFLGNRETRALILDAEFRNFVQGDLSIIDYCKKFKKMAAELHELGEHVSDRTLVLNVLHGLNERYAAIGMHLRRGRPFPSFLEVRNDLLLEEFTAGTRSSAPSTALVATAPTGSRPPVPPPQLPKLSNRSRGGGSGGSSKPRHGKRDKGAGGSSGGGTSTSSSGGGGSKGMPASSGTLSPLGPWPSMLNP